MDVDRSLPGLPIVTGDGNADYGCGNCGSVLLSAVTAIQLRQLAAVIQCGRCYAFNRGSGRGRSSATTTTLRTSKRLNKTMV